MKTIYFIPKDEPIAFSPAVQAEQQLMASLHPPSPTDDPETGEFFFETGICLSCYESAYLKAESHTQRELSAAITTIMNQAALTASEIIQASNGNDAEALINWNDWPENKRRLRKYRRIIKPYLEIVMHWLEWNFSSLPVRYFVASEDTVIFTGAQPAEIEYEVAEKDSTVVFFEAGVD
ncbi:MAG: hypothetical protein JNL74_23260 [Fibrobacteres bacterium]|nr:hypothetical protein [Fibrobacterota bacterium]